MQYKQNISLIYNIINYILIKFSTINICNKILLHILYSKYYCTQVVSARSWEGGHWWVCLPMPLVYVVFSVIYWAAGGTNEVGIWVILYYLNYSVFQKINEIVDRFTQMCCVVTRVSTNTRYSRICREYSRIVFVHIREKKKFEFREYI